MPFLTLNIDVGCSLVVADLASELSLVILVDIVDDETSLGTLGEHLILLADQIFRRDGLTVLEPRDLCLRVGDLAL